MQSIKKMLINGAVVSGLFFGLMFSANAEGGFKPPQWMSADSLYLIKAEQGDAIAQYNMGTLYYSGKGVEQDYTKARQWYEKAANQGLADAQVKLGLMYHLGYGVSQNMAAAVEWYGKACDNGLQLGCDGYRLFKE